MKLLCEHNAKVCRTVLNWYFNYFRLREHVEDASKNPILIFPEGE